MHVGLFGAGGMAASHLQALASMAGIEVPVVVSRRPASSRRLADEFGVPAARSAADDPLAEFALDACVVAVPPEATIDVVTPIIEAGVPVLVEKPVGLHAGAARALGRLARDRGVITAVGVNRRYYATVLGALLAVQQHGPLRGVLVESHEPITQRRQTGSLSRATYDRWLVANSIHHIDLLRLFGGEIAEFHVLRRSVREPLGDHFTASLRFESGALGTFVAHWDSAGTSGATVFGEGVTAEVRPLESGYVTYADKRRVKLHPDRMDLRLKPGVFAQDAAFLDAVAHGRAVGFPGSDILDHAETMALAERLAGVDS